MKLSETDTPTSSPQDPRPALDTLLAELTARSKQWTRVTLEHSARTLASWSDALHKAAHAIEPPPAPPPAPRDGVIPEQPSA
jgi:hypothetical protein